MPSALVRFRPTGPWRFGPDSGTRDRVDLVFHSDSLYAAVTNAMLRLEFLDEWLDATARKKGGEPEVRFSSLFPFQRDLLFVTPPRGMWPPPPSTKVRFKSARFVPLSVVQLLLSEQPIDENRWIIDGESQCMIPSGEGPFRIGLRTSAAIDRISAAAVDPHTTACLEFGRDAGLWTMVLFSTDESRERWRPRVESAFRLLADSGFGGERSRGWGRSQDPEWNGGRSPGIDLFQRPVPTETPVAHWLLSLYAAADADGVDWKTGNYGTVTRTGRAESTANWGALKAPTLMITEGSVIVAQAAPCGEARDVTPEGFPHPVYRSGFAVAIPIPWKAPGAVVPQKAEPTRAKPMAAPVVEPEPVVPESAPESDALTPQTESEAPPESETPATSAEDAEAKPETHTPESSAESASEAPAPESDRAPTLHSEQRPSGSGSTEPEAVEPTVETHTRESGFLSPAMQAESAAPESELDAGTTSAEQARDTSTPESSTIAPPPQTEPTAPVPEPDAATTSAEAAHETSTPESSTIAPPPQTEPAAPEHDAEPDPPTEESQVHRPAESETGTPVPETPPSHEHPKPTHDPGGDQ